MKRLTSDIRTNKESRWHRPRLYLTIVGIYLLILLGIFLSVIGSLLYQGSVCNDSAYVCSHRYDRSNAEGVLIFGVIILVFIILGIPSIKASFVLIWKQRKKKISPVVALVFWDLFFIFLTFWELSGISGNHIELYIETYLEALALLGSNGLMFVFLIKGWKQVDWNQPK